MSWGLKNILGFRFGSIVRAEAQARVSGRYRHFLWLAGRRPAAGCLASLTPDMGTLSAGHLRKRAGRWQPWGFP